MSSSAQATHVALPQTGAVGAPADLRAAAGVRAGPDSREHELRRALAKWALLFGLWSIAGLISSSQVYFLWSQKDQPLPFRTALLWQYPPWLFWALMTPVIHWLGRRFPLERGTWPKSVVVHLLANLAIAPCHIAIASLFGRLAGQPYYLTKPFGEIVGRMLGKYADLDVLIYLGILAIVHAFEYHRRYREGELVAARLETQLAQAELEALKMQLHPHFLFNTLHTIAVLVRKQDTQKSIRMITGLSDMLRHALENVGRQVVPLKQELDFLNRYLDIERTRFQDRLTVRMGIAPETLDAQIPSLVLQPIVENAIRHGIAPRASSGLLEIDAEKEAGALVVRVRDDGKGLGAGWDATGKSGVGLRNVRARLSQLYPRDHRFSIEERPEGGVVVTLRIPFCIEMPEHANG